MTHTCESVLNRTMEVQILLTQNINSKSKTALLAVAFKELVCT